MIKNIIFLFLLFESSLIVASALKVAGEVNSIKGRATQLAPGETLARRLREGDKIKEDTSIVTHEKSYIKISFVDGSSISLGPNSKAVITKMDDKGNGIIGHLKGRMRTHVEPVYHYQKKFYIRTITAAIGVRGTNFETIHNPINQVTTLITYSGEVAMVAVDNSDNDKTNIGNEKRVVRTFDNKIILEEEPGLSKTNFEKLETITNSKDVVIVKRGQFAQTLNEIHVISQPVKMSPIQLNALFKNTTFHKNHPFKIKKAKKGFEGMDFTILPEKQDAPLEGVYNPIEKKFAHKSGGYIDFETGFYIPPSKDALFDREKQIYVAENIGEIDESTGQYEPPLGVKLHETEGFKSRKLKGSAPDTLKNRVNEDVKRLNNLLVKDLVVGTTKNIEDISRIRGLSNRELISKNILTLNYMPFSQTISQNTDTYLGTSKNYDSSSARDIKIAFEYASEARWQPTSFLIIRKLEIPTEERGTSVSQSGDNLMGLGLGLKYSVSSRWNINLNLKLDQQYFLHHTTSNSVTTSQFTRITIPKFSLGLSGTLIRFGRFSLESGLLAGLNLSKETGDHKLEVGYHYEAFGELKYWIFEKYFLGLGYNYLHDSYGVSSTNATYTADVTRNSSGVMFTLGHFF